MAGEIDFAAILRGTEFRGEVGDPNAGSSGSPNLRNIALSIAAQATRADVACVRTNKVLGCYIKRGDGYISVAVGAQGTVPRVLLAFLKGVDTRLGAALAAHETPEFNKLLVEAQREASARPDTLAQTAGELDEVRQIMVENVDRLLERGERVDLLVNRTGEMSQSANLFNRQATRLQRKLWFQNVRLIAAGAVTAAVVLFVLAKIFIF